MSVQSKMLFQNITLYVVLALLTLCSAFVVMTYVASVYLGARVTENLPDIAGGYFLVMAFVALLLVAMIVAASALMNRKNLLEPLKSMKRAAREIQNGNLGYELVISGEGEIRELAVALEQMRLKLKASVDESRRLESERAMLIAGISHDLKTPVTSILGYADGILDGVADSPERVERYARVIGDKARELETLVADLLLLSQLENARLVLDCRSCEVDALITECARSHLPEIEERGGSLALSCGSGALCSLDRGKFCRVVDNIISNSIKHRGEGPPHITISSRIQGSEVLVEFSDDGPGVGSGEEERVFGSFYRSDESRSLTKGYGLGLAIARHLVELHGGRIWIRSRDGTHVFILLPIREGDDEKDSDH